MIHLSIDCVPISWSAPQKGKNGFYDKKSTHKEQVKWQLKTQYREKLIQGSISLDFIFFIPIPKTTSKIRKKQMIERRILPTSPDITNLQKLYEDCLQGIVIENDRQVNRTSSVRFYSEKPSVSILVRTWEEDCEKHHRIERALEFEKKHHLL